VAYGIDAASDLRLDAASLGVLGRAAAVRIGVQVQARYDINLRDDASLTLASPDDDLTAGFSIRRTKVEFSADITESLSAQIVFAFDRSGGEGSLENAYGRWEFGDGFGLQVGQFKPAFLREETVSSKRQLLAERSSMNETFNQDFSQGVQLGYDADTWRGMVAITDGFASRNTPTDDDTEADFAMTARVELKFGDASWRQFRQFTSFRGATPGGMLGLAGHFESRGETNPAAPVRSDFSSWTADFSWLGDGWNAYGSVVYRRTDTGAAAFDDFGAVVQAGLFVTDDAEVFARWSGVFGDSSRGATGEGYSDISLGMNYYLAPESHAAKFTLAMTYTLDPTTGSIVRTSNGHNLFNDSEDGQIGVTAQLQLLF
jgi:hypothetical protein